MRKKYMYVFLNSQSVFTVSKIVGFGNKPFTYRIAYVYFEVRGKCWMLINATKYAYLNTYLNTLFFIKISVEHSTNKLRNFWYKRFATGCTAYSSPATVARACVWVRDACTRVQWAGDRWLKSIYALYRRPEHYNLVTPSILLCALTQKRRLITLWEFL